MGSNFTEEVFVKLNTIYLATSGGLSISTNGGTSFINKTIADGLGSNSVEATFVTSSIVYAGTDGGLSISSVISGGTISITAVEQSDDDGASDPYTEVPDNQLIGQLSNFQPIQDFQLNLPSDTLGAFGTSRFLRLVLEVTTFSDDFEMLIMVNGGVELSPGDN